MDLVTDKEDIVLLAQGLDLRKVPVVRNNDAGGVVNRCSDVKT